MAADDATTEQIERMREVLPRMAPALWADFAPPAPDVDIEVLKDALGEWSLPDPIETWLRFTNGTHHHIPIVECGFLRARDMAAFYTNGLEFFAPGLLHFAYASHVQASIELQTGRPQLIIDTTVDEPSFRVIAPSFPLLLAAIVDLAEAGHLADYPPALEELPNGVRPVDEARMDEVREHWQGFFDRAGWGETPFPPYVSVDRWSGRTPDDWGLEPEL